jgi:hypothetical protein
MGEMTSSSIAVKSFVFASLAAAACAMASCTGGLATSPGPAAGTVPAPPHALSASSTQFVLSLSPVSLTYLHATSPAQSLTMVVADQRTITIAVQDPTVANAVLSPNSITLPNNAGFQDTITVSPLKPGVTNLFVNTQKGTVATVPIDVYAELQASPVGGNVIFCKKPSDCTATSTLGGASLNFVEQFYPNSYSLTADTCQTSTNATIFAVGGTFALQLTPAAYTQLVNNAIANNQKTESVTCNTTVSATESVSTAETFTVTFQSLQRGAGL